jgi:transposase
MSRKKRFIQPLTEEDRLSLEKGYKTGNSHVFRRKCHAILLNARGVGVGDLSVQFGVCAHTVYKWLDSWESAGLDGLKPKPGRGRKPKLSTDNEEQVRFVKELVENEPRNLNRGVALIEKGLSIQLGKKTLKRFLKKTVIGGSVSARG